MNRRHDIDALRALAFSLLILYHLAMLYVFEWGWHIKSSYLSEALQFPMLFVNRWRMDLIFLISGISTAFLMQTLAKRGGTANFLSQRTWRLMLPLLFGMTVVVPVQPYCQGVANGLVEPGFLQFIGRYYSGYPWPAKAFDGWKHGFTWNHLWYLAYLWCYTVLLVVLQKPLASKAGQKLRSTFLHFRSWRLLVWPAVPLLLYTATLQSSFPQNNALTKDWYAHALYFTVFLYGWWLGSDEGIWAELSRLRRQSLVVALIAFSLYMLVRAFSEDDSPPHVYLLVWTLRNLYIWTALCTILGWGYVMLNRPFRWLPWATQAVYPWYILHQSLIVLLAFWLVPMKLGPVVEPLLVGFGTVAGCWLITSGLVKRNQWLRACFGLKPIPRSDQAETAPSQPVHQ
ncbi:MAG: acyltransferase [Betaproteobacteria bacterium]